MIRKSDIQWWLLEARKDPAAAPGIIEALASRLAELDTENERLRDELIRLRRGTAPPPDSAQVGELQRKVDSLQAILKGQASTETAVILISDAMQVVRMPLSQVRLRLRGQEPALTRSAVLSVCTVLLARPQDDLLLLSSQGRLRGLSLHKVPFQVEENRWPTLDASTHPAGEQAAAAVAVAKPPRFWTVVTRRGYVRQLLRVHVDKQVGEDDVVVKSPFHHDAPVAIVDGDRGDLFLITRWGKAIRFPQRAIGVKGVVAMEVDPDDEIVAALPIASDGEILILTAAGYAMRRDTTRFRAQSKVGGPGKAFIQAFDVLGAFHYAERGKLLYLTYSGHFVAVKTAGIATLERASRGSLVHDLSKDPAVAVTFVPGALL